MPRSIGRGRDDEGMDPTPCKSRVSSSPRRLVRSRSASRSWPPPRPRRPTRTPALPGGPFARFELPDDWEARFWADPNVKALLALDAKALAELVPVQAGVRFCRCPGCDASEADDPLVWALEQAGGRDLPALRDQRPQRQIPRQGRPRPAQDREDGPGRGRRGPPAGHPSLPVSHGRSPGAALSRRTTLPLRQARLRGADVPGQGRALRRGPPPRAAGRAKGPGAGPPGLRAPPAVRPGVSRLRDPFRSARPAEVLPAGRPPPPVSSRLSDRQVGMDGQPRRPAEPGDRLRAGPRRPRAGRGGPAIEGGEPVPDDRARPLPRLGRVRPPPARGIQRGLAPGLPRAAGRREAPG